MTTNRKHRRIARHLYRACLTDGQIDDGRAREAAQRMARSGRRGALPILSEFKRLVRLDRDRHTAIVESAAPLAGDLRDGIQSDLVRLYGPRFDTLFRQNPALIGGIRIRVGSDVYDSSVRARLAVLASRL